MGFALLEAVRTLVAVPPMRDGEGGITGRDWDKTARFYDPDKDPKPSEVPASGILPHAPARD